MVRPGSGRFEVGFWVGFRVGLRARDFPTEGVLSRTPLIIRTVSGSEPLYGSAWFGSVWGGILGGILGGIARAGFSHRESALPDPLNY